MQTAIATVCLSGVLNEKLEAIAAAGFKGVEMFENDLLSFNGTPADVRRMIEDLGLRTITFQPFRDFEGMPEDRRARVFQRAERKFDLMQELGCDLLMICSNVSPESLGGIDRSAADLHEIGERAAKRGLRVGFEALAWGRHINDYRDAWEAVRCADHPAIGVVLDSFHILARKTDLGAIRSIPRDRVFLVQIADAPCSKWTTYPGVATTAISRAKANCRFRRSCRRSLRQATMGCFHWRSSTTSSGPGRRAALRSTDTARLFICLTRFASMHGMPRSRPRPCRLVHAASARNSSSSPSMRVASRNSKPCLWVLVSGGRGSTSRSR
jgi:sugar phosphate isomerase/epimerase